SRTPEGNLFRHVARSPVFGRLQNLRVDQRDLVPAPPLMATAALGVGSYPRACQDRILLLSSARTGSVMRLFCVESVGDHARSSPQRRVPTCSSPLGLAWLAARLRAAV